MRELGQLRIEEHDRHDERVVPDSVGTDGVGTDGVGTNGGQLFVATEDLDAHPDLSLIHI